MKIAFVGPFINMILKEVVNLGEEDLKRSPGMGGHGLIELVEERLLRKHHTIVITLDEKLEKESIIRKNNYCSLYSLPRRKKGKLRDFFLKERNLIQDAINDSNPDLIHAHWTNEYSLSVINLGIPTIITAHDNPKEILRYLGKKYLLSYFISNHIIKKAKFMTAVSPNVFDYLKKMKKSNVEIIPNGLSNAIKMYANKRTRDYSYESPSIISVLDWNRLKNPKNAILAFNLILKEYPNAVLHLFGKGMEEVQDCAKWCKRNRKEKNILFHGKVDKEVILKYLEQSTALLHTSRTEACSMIIAEAMILGIPIVAGKESGGVPWQLDYGKAGLLVDINNPEEVHKGLIYLLKDSKIREKIGKNAKERASSMFDINKIIKKWDETYSNVYKNS